jgi:hypothetical protein
LTTSNPHTQADIESGDTVHDHEGRVLGVVDEATDDGFEVAVIEVDGHAARYSTHSRHREIS